VEPRRYHFEVGDVLSVDLPADPFDIVLCLGLLYHVSKPFELMERMSACNDDLLVIDTRVDRIPGQYFRIVRQDVDRPRSAVDRTIALHPTSEAVVRLARAFGYRSVMLRPRFTSWEGSGSYRRGDRRAFICAKRTELHDLDTEPPGANAPKPIVITRADVIPEATVVPNANIIRKAMVVVSAKAMPTSLRDVRRLLRSARSRVDKRGRRRSCAPP
jgi:hypothetical protein